MWMRLTIAAVTVCAILGAGWYGFGKGYQRRDLEAKAQVLAAEQQARAVEQLMTKKLQEAQTNARKRETALRRDADAARGAALSLRDQLAHATRALSGATCDASREYAATVNELFGQCAERYRAVAEQADKHSSDSVMLQEAWPK